MDTLTKERKFVLCTDGSEKAKIAFNVFHTNVAPHQ